MKEEDNGWGQKGITCVGVGLSHEANHIPLDNPISTIWAFTQPQKDSIEIMLGHELQNVHIIESITVQEVEMPPTEIEIIGKPPQGRSKKQHSLIMGMNKWKNR